MGTAAPSGEDLTLVEGMFESITELAGVEATVRAQCIDVDPSYRYHRKDYCDGRMSLALMIAMLVMGFFAFFINLGVVIRTVKIVRHGHFNKPAFFFIGNLALSDLAMGLYIIIAFLLHITNRSDLWDQNTCMLQIGVAASACQEKVFTIVLISVDKYLYICHGLHYSLLVTKRRVYVALAVSWVVAILVGFLPAMGLHVSWEEACHRCSFPQVVSTSFTIIFFLTSVLVPLCVVASLYIILLVIGLKMHRARYGSNHGNGPNMCTTNVRLSMSNMSKSGSSGKATSSTFTSSLTSASSTPKTAAKRPGTRKNSTTYKATLPGLVESEAAAKLITYQPGNAAGASPHISAKAHTTDGGRAKRQGSSGTTPRLQPLSESSVPAKKLAALQRDDVEAGKSISAEGAHTDLHVNNPEQDTGEEDCEGRSDPPSVKEDSANEEFNNTIGSNGVAESPVPHTSPAGGGQGGGVTTRIHNNGANKKSPEDPGCKGRESVAASYSSTDDEDADGREPQPSTKDKVWLPRKYFNRVMTDTRDKVQFLKKCRAVKTVFLILGSFTATYVPFVVGSMVYSVSEEKQPCLLHSLNTLLYCAVVANSLANPLIYAYGYREFRMKTKKFKGVFARETSSKFT